MRLALALLLLFLASCAGEPWQQTATERRLNETTSRERQVAELISQAEALRQANELDVAAQLYQRVEALAPGNARAKAGLAAIEADRRHQRTLAETEKLLREDKQQEASDKVELVLAENPANREARRLQRSIEEKLQRPAITPVRLR